MAYHISWNIDVIFPAGRVSSIIGFNDKTWLRPISLPWLTRQRKLLGQHSQKTCGLLKEGCGLHVLLLPLALLREFCWNLTRPKSNTICPTSTISSGFLSGSEALQKVEVVGTTPATARLSLYLAPHTVGFRWVFQPLILRPFPAGFSVTGFSFNVKQVYPQEQQSNPSSLEPDLCLVLERTNQCALEALISFRCTLFD